MNGNEAHSIIFYDSIITRTLCQLVIRRHGKLSETNAWWSYKLIKGWHKECSICGQLFDGTHEGYMPLAEHGMKHLKEHGLLALL